MAIATPGLAAHISGNVDAVEFKTAKSGIVIAKKKVKTTPTTPAAVNARAQFQRGLKVWQTLNADQKQMWAKVAATLPRPNRLAIPKTRTPLQAFLTCWHDFSNLRNPPIFDVPITLTTRMPDAFNLALSASGTYTIETIGGYPKAFDAYEFVFISRFCGRGQKTIPARVTCIGLFEHDPNQTDYKARFAAKNIVLLQGEKVFVSVIWWWSGYWPAAPVWKFATVAA